MCGFLERLNVILTILCFWVLIPCAQAQVTGERVLTHEEYVPDMEFTVKLMIKGISGDFTVIEKVPPGWIINQAYQRGVIDQEAGTITWKYANLFSMFYFDPAETRWVYFLSREIHFTDPVYAALVVHAFTNKDLFITAQFSDVQFSHLPDMSSMKNWELFK